MSSMFFLASNGGGHFPDACFGKGLEMITRRSMIATSALGLVLFVAPRVSLAAEHLTQTIGETKEAIQEGRSGYPASLVEHATNALDHARAAQRAKADPNLETGIKHLRRAIRTAQGTHSQRRTAAAVRHAETALTHFQSAR
ncbi:small metal-binding protein SmbP [Methylosinus sp. Ce-a6]|uniref:small metal-binding protein SmbP n=1 Tax=Methylosinus sp. Ce-a6 TaxID=2172005 RepID=UPI0013596219|nr:small metal-binding protein SmbP [Methylosinus sp. Ce-a6]